MSIIQKIPLEVPGETSIEIVIPMFLLNGTVLTCAVAPPPAFTNIEPAGFPVALSTVAEAVTIVQLADAPEDQLSDRSMVGVIGVKGGTPLPPPPPHAGIPKAAITSKMGR